MCSGRCLLALQGLVIVGFGIVSPIMGGGRVACWDGGEEDEIWHVRLMRLMSANGSGPFWLFSLQPTWAGLVPFAFVSGFQNLVTDS